MQSERACPLCGGFAFTRIGAMTQPTWQDHSAVSLEPVDDRTQIGVCRACNHVMVTSALPPAMVERMYRPNPGAFLNPLFCYQAPEPPGYIIEMCQPHLIACDGLIVDFGCGNGWLLSMLRMVYGFNAERLLGIDYAQRVPDDLPFLQANLDALEAEHLAARLPGAPGFLFSTHMLEHLQDPRRFLQQIRLLCSPQTVIYLEVPDALVSRPDVSVLASLITFQHLHYFTERSLHSLVTSCGFEVLLARRDPHAVPARLMFLLRPCGAPSAEALVRYGLARVEGQRLGACARILATAAKMPVGLWGIGTDFLKLCALDSRLAELVELADRGRLALFDVAHAGKTVNGVTIAHPDRIRDFEGVVFMLPYERAVRGHLLAAATAMKLPPGRVLDFYDDPH